MREECVMLKKVELTNDQKVGLFLVLAEKIKLYFSNDEYKKAADKALEKCWEWFEEKSISENQLYKLIDSPLEDDIVCLQEMAIDENDIGIWDCIIYAVAFTCKSAYEYNGKKYFPQPIEIIDFGHYEESKLIYKRVSLEPEKTLDMIEHEFLANGNNMEQRINKSMLKKYFKE